MTKSNNDPFYLICLREELEGRKRLNTKYGLRSFAQFLGVHPGNLSSVMAGKRPFPKKWLAQVVAKLELDAKEMDKFGHSISEKLLFAEGRILEEESNFDLIAHWEYFALFELIKTSDFQTDPEWIAKKLGISHARAEEVFTTLLEKKLIQSNDKGQCIVMDKALDTTTDVPSRALRQSHKETLELAKQKIDQVEIDKRHYCSETIAVNLNQIPKAKKLIEEFRKKLSAILEEGDEHQEVYQMAVQLFPLTQLGDTK